MEHGSIPRLTNAYKVANAFKVTVYDLWELPRTKPKVDASRFDSLSLRDEREKKKLSLEAFAKKSGVPKNTIYRIESGQAPSLVSAARIAAAHQLSVYQIWKPPDQVVSD